MFAKNCCVVMLFATAVLSVLAFAAKPSAH